MAGLNKLLKQAYLKNEQSQHLIQTIRKEADRAIGGKLDKTIDSILELMLNN